MLLQFHETHFEDGIENESDSESCLNILFLPVCRMRDFEHNFRVHKPHRLVIIPYESRMLAFWLQDFSEA